MNLKKLKNNKKGFTLIEIIVVVVILAVLMAVAVPAVMSYLDEADNAKYETAGHALFTAVQTEYSKDYADDKQINGSYIANGNATSYLQKASDRVTGDDDSIEIDAPTTNIQVTTGSPNASNVNKSVKSVKAKIKVNGVEKTVIVDANKSVKVS